ncbi:MAG: hypothetical protein ACXU98_06695 [Syntrophales bacterium]
MKIIKTLFFQSLVLTAVVASFNVYALDQSICMSDTNVVLHENGSLKACQLKNDYDANDIRCKNEGPVSFYSDGNLESCVLSATAIIGDIKCKESGPISFYIDGKLKSCLKPED